MPIMDSIQMTSEIKAINPEITVIGISGNSDKHRLQNAIEAGFNHYMKKPTMLHELCSLKSRITLTRLIVSDITNA